MRVGTRSVIAKMERGRTWNMERGTRDIFSVPDRGGMTRSKTHWPAFWGLLYAFRGEGWREAYRPGLVGSLSGLG